MAIRRNWRPAAMRIGYLGLAVLAFCWGRYTSLPEGTAAPPGAKEAAPPTPPEASSDYARRWVAVIHGNVPITREDFGEYLIARYSDKLELLVNKRIIDYACKQRGIEVTPAEVDGALTQDLKEMKISLKDFVEVVLKRYGKTLYEWKEDVIRPKLCLTKMCRDRVHVTEQDLKDAFEAYYGEKVDCRLVLFGKGEDKAAMNLYADLRKSDEDFNRIARQQKSPTLASTGGQIQPIGHHTTGNEELEKEAFSLQPGEVSRLIGTPEGTAVLKCIKRIPPDTSKKLEQVRPTLEKEIIDKKTQLELAKFFKELQDQAQPKLFIKNYTTQADLERDVKRELQGGSLPDVRGPVERPLQKPPMK
jgi:hypothetical protein